MSDMHETQSQSSLEPQRPSREFLNDLARNIGSIAQYNATEANEPSDKETIRSRSGTLLCTHVPQVVFSKAEELGIMPKVIDDSSLEAIDDTFEPNTPLSMMIDSIVWKAQFDISSQVNSSEIMSRPVEDAGQRAAIISVRLLELNGARIDIEQFHESVLMR